MEETAKKLEMDLKMESTDPSCSVVSFCLMESAYSSCLEVSSCPHHLMDLMTESGYSSCSEVSCCSLHLPCPPSDGGGLW